MKKHATTVTTALLVAILAVGLATTAAADEDIEFTDVTVDIAAETALDVKPDDLTYQNAEVGDRVIEDIDGFDVIQIENTGSNPIEEIWLDTTMPNESPFGTGDGTAYDSANFLQVRPTDADTVTAIRGDHEDFHFAQRVEFFEDEAPLVETGDSWAEADSQDIDVGRMRFGDQEFYFAIGYDTDTCEGDAQSEIRIADTATTADALGTYDFSDEGDQDWTNYTIETTDTNYGITGQGPNENGVEIEIEDDEGNVVETFTYDLLTDCSGTEGDLNEPHVIVNKFNNQAGGNDDLEANQGTATTQLYRAGDNLEPGANFAVDVGVQIPRGVPEGGIDTGTLSIFSVADTTA